LPGSIQVRHLEKTFGDARALWPLDLTVDPGSIVGLIGPNGSGKSTLMRCLVGLTRPDRGEIWVDGLRLTGDGVGVRKRLTYAPGEMGVYREMRGREHLHWLLRGRDRAARERGQRLAQDLGLPLQRRVGTYSHGMKRQLVFAAAMAPRVPIRILDEITEGLDPSRRTEVTEVLEADRQSGTTILLSSHHFGEVDRVCERILFLQAGKVLEDASSARIRDRAARLLRVVWSTEAEAMTYLDSLPSEAYLVKHRRVHECVIELADHDPRPILAHLKQLPGPPPLRLQFGSTTLADLYRDLYGVEGT